MAVAATYQRDKSQGLKSLQGTQRQIVSTIYDTSKVPSLNLPTVTPGDPLPYVYGTRKISQPKIFYYGNLQPLFVESVSQDTVITTSMQGQLDPGNSYLNQAIVDAGGIGDSSEPKPTSMYVGQQPGQSPNTSVNLNPYIAAGLAGKGYTIRPRTPIPIFQDQVTTTITLSDYTIDLGIAICLGEGVRLKKIYSGKDLIWEGELSGGQGIVNDTVGDDGTLLYPQLGRGFVFYDGSFTQTPDAYLRETADDPSTISALPGISYIYFIGIAASLANGSSYSFEVSRKPNPLSLALADLTANGLDINPACAMVDILTDEWGALGIDIANIDLPAFTAAAGVWASENLFASDLITDDSGGVSAVKDLQNMTGSIIYCDPSTGFITIALYRDTILTTNLPVLELDDSNVVQLQSIQKPNWISIPDMMEIDFTNRDNDYQNDDIQARNPATPPSTTRRVNKFSLSEKCICESDVAEDALLLYLANNSSPKLSMTAIVDASASNVLPGQIVMLTWPEYGMSEIAYWVKKWRENDNGRYSLDLEQYQFLGVSKYFKAAEPSQYVRKDITVKAPTDARLLSSPLLVAQWGGLSSDYAVNVLYDYMVCLVEPGNDFQAFAALYDATTGLQVQGNINYTPTATLVDALPVGHYMAHEIDIKAPVYFGALRKSQTYPEINAKPVIIFLDDEILTYESMTDNGDGTWTLKNVYRGLIDTLQGAHDAGAKLWFYDSNDASRVKPGRVYNVPDPVTYGFVGIDLNGRSSAVTFAIDTVPTNRIQLPLRPQGVTINGKTGVVNVTAGASIRVDWKLRTRVQQTLTLPEEGSDWLEHGADDPLYAWQPVVQFFAHYDDFPLVSGAVNSRLAWETLGHPDETVSAADHVYFTISPDVTGAGHLDVTAFWYDYTNGTNLELVSQTVRVDFYVEPSGIFASDLTLDYGIGFTSDLTLDYAMNITIATLIYT